METATIFSFGAITSLTLVSPNSKIRCSIFFSSSLNTPSSLPISIIIRNSSSVIRGDLLGGSTLNSLKIRLLVPMKTEIIGSRS